VGQQPRMTNVAVADLVESLNPRSSVTLAGAYGLVHFINSGFINSRQISAQAGYNYQINRKDQIAVVYGFQDFRYPSTVGTHFNSHLVSVLYGHRISGRMDLILGGGPQLTQIHTCVSPLSGIPCVPVSNSRLSGAGRATLRYRFPKTSLGLSYDHYNTTGSGLFVGATSDVARFDATRPLGRVWSGTANIGFSHNRRVASNPLVSPVNNARTFDYLYAGGAVHRQLGRQFSLFIGYQFNNLAFDSTFCGTATSCSRMSQRHVGLIGLDWHPRPIRLD
jgi:hypothetical protein